MAPFTTARSLTCCRQTEKETGTWSVRRSLSSFNRWSRAISMRLVSTSNPAVDLVSNALKAPSSFKHNPHDTFIIASSLIRVLFQIWLNNAPGISAGAQTHRHWVRHISVSWLPGWLIDCGCSDTLCRIGILPLIGAGTNSSRTAGDWGNRSSTGKWLGLGAGPEKPHRCHSAFSLGQVYIVYVRL